MIVVPSAASRGLKQSRMPNLDNVALLPSDDGNSAQEGEVSTVSPTELQALWSRILLALRGIILPQQLETWFRRMALVHVDDQRACVAVHHAFARNWLVEHYQEPLRKAIERALGSPRTLEIRIDPERSAAVATDPAAPAASEPESPGEPVGDELAVAPQAPATALPEAPGGLLSSSDFILNPYYRFDSFIVGPCNRFAHAACIGVSEKPARSHNPLFIHGNSGLGKTHLIQSLCHTMLERSPGTRILYLSCESFVNHFISALERGDVARFREKYRSVNVLLVDDIHLLARKERTQEEFFHTFNTLYNAGSQIVLTADSSPVGIPTLQERLVSRFGWGLVTHLEPPCYETRVAILKRKSRERGHELPDEIARFLAERIETNVRELEGAVNRVLGFASVNGKPIDLQLVRQCMRELFTERRGQPTTDDIMRVVTARFGIKPSELQSRRRTNAVVLPRQVGMYLARRVTRMSLEEIGHFFGGRDHSTVLYGIEKIGRLMREHPETRALVTQLLIEVQGPDTA